MILIQMIIKRFEGETNIAAAKEEKGFQIEKYTH